MLWILLGVVLAAALVLIPVRRGLQIRKLVDGGVTTEGTVAKKWRHTSSGTSKKRIRYEFKDRNGHTYSRAIAASETEYGQLAVGDKIKVVYLPNQPKINALESLVDLAKEALRKKAPG
jgi:hypothetical protein